LVGDENVCNIHLTLGYFMFGRNFAVLFLIAGLAAPLVALGAPEPYTIQAGDQLQVVVYGLSGTLPPVAQGPAPPAIIQSLSQTVTVLSDGTVTYPLIGSISVTGLTADAASDRLTAAMRRYVIRPRVSVIIARGKAATFYVLGAVDHGGQFDLERDDRLANAIVEAGVGVNSLADLNHITINRVVDGVPHVYNVNLYNMLLNADYSANLPLKPGDVVYVPKAKQTNLSNLANLPAALYYLYLLVTPGITRGLVSPP
jgi:protein involved in polysaccharide export with SLBB domain